MSRSFWTYAAALALSIAVIAPSRWATAADDAKKPALADAKEVKPIKALLVLGGCCHDYAKQKDILSKGISERANVEWVIAYDPDKGTKHLNPVYESDDWYKGFDVVVHDECSADVTDMKIIERILKPHKEGLPGVVLHCAMHCYRTEGWNKNGVTPWFEFTGLQSTGHGKQLPIDITYTDKESEITKGLENWTTGNEELYNNTAGKLLDTGKVLARGKQGNAETIVVWTNQYKEKTRVFGTTIGHNNTTVGDPKYLDLVTRGLLWSVGKLDAEHLKPAKRVLGDIPPGFPVEKLAAAAAEANKPAASTAKPAGPSEELLKTVPDAKGMVPQDLAHGKTATASSYQDDEKKAVSAFDGDETSRWCADGGTLPQWLQVDLGKAEDLTGANILWERAQGEYRHKIEGSADGKEWSTLVDHSKSAVKGRVQQEKFSAKGVRYVRVTITGASGGSWASINEFEVLGTQVVPAQTVAAKKNETKQKSNAAQAPADPAKIAASLKAPAGFGLTVYAAPPQIAYPTCVSAAPNGDLFVGIDEMGSLGREAGRGKVVKCIDSNNDGVADKFIEFAKIEHPRGLVWDESAKALYVLYPPFLAVYFDDNGDGVADRSDILVKGIGNDKVQAGRGADHTTNGIRLGIDGWIYVATGDFGAPKAVGKDGAELTYHAGGVIRVRTDGSGLEAYSIGQRNIYDVAIDPYMNVFTRDNTNDGDGWNDRISHVIPTGNYGYPRLFKHFPGEFVDCLADLGGGSPCGALFVDEPALPANVQGFLSVEWGKSIIDRHGLAANGAGFKATTEKVMDLPRGTDLDLDAQGRFYGSSWANGSFNYGGPNVGYLIRLSPKDAKIPAFPELAKVTEEQLVHLLVSPSGVARQAAQREILKRGDKPAFDAIEKLAASNGPLAGRVAAIFTLKQLRGSRADAALTKLAANADVREFALRALADKVNDTGVVSKPFIDALADANPRVRLVAAWGLGRLGRREDAVALVPLASDSDYLVSHVAQNSLVRLRNADALLKAVDTSNPKVAIGALKALQRIHEPVVVEGLVAKLNGIQEPGLRSSIYAAICRLYSKEAEWDGAWWGTRPDTSGPYFKTAEWAGTPKLKQALLSAMATEKGDRLKGLILELQRNKVNAPEIVEQVAKIAGSDPAFREMLLDELLKRQNLSAAEIASTKGIAASDKEPGTIRAKAARALLNAKDAAALDAATEVMTGVIGAEKPAAEMSAALEEFIREPKLANQIPYFTKLTQAAEPAKKELGYSVLVNIADSKLTKGDAKEKAAKAIESGWAKPATAAPLLRAIGRTKADGYKEWIEATATDKNVEVVKASAFASERLGLKHTGPSADTRELIEKLGYDKTLALVLKDKGDPILGKELFTKVGCIACHTTSNAEPPKGPPLAGIAAKYNRTELTESIIKPSAKISQGFETQFFKTEDDLIEGFVTRESGDEVEVRNPAGIAVTLKKTDIKSRGKRETSIMPEGLVVKQSPQDLASLIAYLESLKAN